MDDEDLSPELFLAASSNASQRSGYSRDVARPRGRYQVLARRFQQITELIDEVNKQPNVMQPICYDTYDLCQRYHSNTLQQFNVATLKAICSYFEIPIKTTDKKRVLMDKLSEMISKCQCVSH